MPTMAAITRTRLNNSPINQDRILNAATIPSAASIIMSISMNTFLSMGKLSVDFYDSDVKVRYRDTNTTLSFSQKGGVAGFSLRQKRNIVWS